MYLEALPMPLAGPSLPYFSIQQSAKIQIVGPQVQQPEQRHQLG
jgi:hypothetical protein